MRRYQSITPPPDAEGDIEALSLWAGQGLAQVTATMPAGEIVKEIAEDARRAARELARTMAT
jgi:NAD(P)H-dependent flavin oxidoreductase YrpB (nitropropane dioxygenase family)